MAEQTQDARWFVLWTHSHCEQLVHDQLTGNGFEAFLPTIKTWSRRKRVRRTVAAPMFPGYVFLHHAIDKRAHVAILKTRGLVRILGERWDRLTPVADSEIDGIRRLVTVDAPLMPYPYLREGQQVRIIDGALTGVEGILVQVKPNKGLLVLSVDLLRRSVAVEVDCTQVMPVSAPSTATVRPWRHRTFSLQGA